MKTVNNWEELLEYVNRLGIIHKDKPIGWRQQEFIKIQSFFSQNTGFNVFNFLTFLS